MSISKLRLPLFGVLLLSLIYSACKNPAPPQNNLLMDVNAMPLPQATQKNHIHSIHGDDRPDPYFWLRERENPEVIAYLNAENAYREAVMAPLKSFENALYEEIIGRIKQDDVSVPYFDNGYWYITKMEEGKEYPAYVRRKGAMENPEEILLDVNQMAKDYAYYQVGSRQISPDNQWLAFAEDTLSRRIYTIRFKNLVSGEIISTTIPGTSGNIVWANDNKTVFYTIQDETLRAYKIFKHKIGTSSTEDVLVYHEKDETFSTYITKSRSKQFLLIGSQQTISSEYRYLNADTPDGKFVLFQPRERNLEYSLDHFKDKFYIRTNYEARNFQLMTAEVNKTTKENWQTLIPHRTDVLLEDFSMFRDYLVLEERIEGINQIRVRGWDGQQDHYVAFGEQAYVANVGQNPEFETTKVRLQYTSMTTPNSTMEYDMATQSLSLLKEDEVVGDFDKSNYVSERLFATAADGTRIPVSIVYHKDFKKDGKQPLLLYGYGSYGYSMDPYFSSTRLSLLDRGFAFAIAHIRGGEEMGRHWYEDGKLLNKKNTFTDFINVAEFLIGEQYTYPGNLYAMGGSAGGLLMGAVINMRPDLWKGVISAVPFVDVVTTMLDATIPLTTGEYDEWGNPNDVEYYNYIKSYSPYDNIEAKDYPALLVTTGLHDSQVQYWEPAKWVARLREMKTDNNPLLMFCNMETGHGGASGRFARHRETAMEYAFFLDLAGKVTKEEKK
jgi:oligopeptidase B